MMLFGRSDGLFPHHPVQRLLQHARATCIALFVAMGLAFIAAPAQAAIRYVDPNGVNGGNCLTPATACNRLTDAITAAANGDDIKVAKGTYAEGQIVVSKGVTITGGFDPANAGTLWDTSTYSMTPTVLDGQGTDRVLHITTDNTIVQFLTVRNGNADNAATFVDFGGGILVNNADNVLLLGLIVRNNIGSTSGVSSTGGGIAIVGNSNNIDIQRSFIFSNTASALGGGIGVRPGTGDTVTLEVRSSVIAHNAASEGGAVATAGLGRSVVAFFHTTFGDNDQGTDPADEAIFSTGGSGASANNLQFSYSLATGNNTFLRSNATLTPVVPTTGVIIDTSITTDWTGNLPAILPAKQRALPFVDQAAGDYHLVAGSPAIDLHGNTQKTDLEGRKRILTTSCTPFTLCPMGLSDDSGAYEYVRQAPVTYYVAPAPAGTDDTNNCMNPALPCATLENANKIAIGGDEIRVAQGTYMGGDALCANAAVICIRQGITLTGGFTTTNWNTPTGDPLLTVIDGTNIRQGITVDYDAPTSSAFISNLTVRNGTALGDGAGISIGNNNLGPAQNLTIRNCVVENNNVTGDGDGAGIYANDPMTLTVENCVIAGNRTVDGRGGGLAITDANGDATYTLSNLTVYNNVADRPDENSANGGRGGGIFLEGVGTLRQSEVYSNSAAFSGGGVSTGSNDANPLIDRLYIHDNKAGVGGGFSIFLTGGATLQNSLLARNAATSTVPMTGQSTEIEGGNAIHTPEGGSPTKPLRVINVTIADNNAASGGAVAEAVKVEGLNDLANTRVNEFVNVLISGSETGIRSDGLAVATLTKVLITNDVTTKHVGFSDSRLTGTPLDGVAGFVGGGDYHLVPGADGVDDGDTVAGITHDLDGIPRPVGPAFDIGAYETTLQKQNQTITFAPINNRALADSPFTVNPTASSGLPVQLTSQTLAVCTVNGNEVTLLAEGTCSLLAEQPGNATFNPAPSVTRSFEIGIVAPPQQQTLHLPFLERQ